MKTKVVRINEDAARTARIEAAIAGVPVPVWISALIYAATKKKRK